ncbi:aminotransferase class V-fold PLP-dependent enzyme [Williamsia sterculiae]|uniref:Pyridoxal 5-phosphate dependent beta-lyase n=1 Tax=Williamsia sterculiae TaxID=1344003 RepID=A0A1N7FGK8_9NOCA|nr:aminotransferase class V-fold PLP-dependent enzyme [Williamsia sterculiae]SIR99433.1 pyridoxal 5-phosphate dependent beta-lyase [Williamsia sterculiae]
MYVSELGEPWHRARVEPALTHLDSASAARSSNRVIESLTEHLWREAEHGSYVAAAAVAGRLEQCRADLSTLVGMGPDEVVFRDGSTAALRALLNRWDLPAAATVWVGENEYGPNLDEFARRGLTVQTVPSTDEVGTRVDVDALAGRLRSARPDVIHLCHLGSYNGVVQPLGRIVELAHAAGVPVVVDAAQSLGQTDCAFGADAVYGTSRKWLTGPRGVGFVGVRSDGLLRAEIDDPQTFIAGRLGLGVAVRELHDVGIERVHRELARVGAVTRERVADVDGWVLRESVDEPSAIVTLAPPIGWEPADVLAAKVRLQSSGILVTCADSWRAPLTADGSVLRFSPHLGVRYDDLDRLVGELRAMGR